MKKIMLLAIAFLSVASLFNTTAKADDLSEFKAEAGIVDNKYDKAQMSKIKKAIKYGFKNSKGKFVAVDKKYFFNTTWRILTFGATINDELEEEDFVTNIINDSKYEKEIKKVLDFQPKKGKKEKKPIIEFNLLDNSLVDALHVDSAKKIMTYYSNGKSTFTAKADKVYTWGNVPMVRPATTRVANNEFAAHIKDSVRGDKLSFVHTYINRWEKLNEESLDYDSGIIVTDGSFKFFDVAGKKDKYGEKVVRNRGYFIQINLSGDNLKKVANETSPYHFIIVE